MDYTLSAVECIDNSYITKVNNKVIYGKDANSVTVGLSTPQNFEDHSTQNTAAIALLVKTEYIAAGF